MPVVSPKAIEVAITRAGDAAERKEKEEEEEKEKKKRSKEGGQEKEAAEDGRAPVAEEGRKGDKPSAASPAGADDVGTRYTTFQKVGAY